MFKEVKSQQNFPELEKEIIAFWQENDSFRESIRIRDKEKSFVFYDGPPFATGLPHYGHILAGVLKDVIPRYKTMQGYRVERNFGWDCHGLPVENLIEKELKLEDKAAIDKFGIDNFNEECRSSVLRYVDEWEKTVNRMGRWVDFENDYKTMNPEYMESVWWVFKQLWEKDLVYQGLKPMHVCPRCVTPLSNFEVNQGYKDLTDISVTVKFKVKELENTYFLAWTTTPWTLPGNMLLALNPDIKYVFMSNNEETLILAEDRLTSYEKELSEYQEVNRMKGKDLVKQQISYEPLFDYYADTQAFYLVNADFVTTDSGTGIVHIAPAFGEDDLEVGKKEKLNAIQHLGMDGYFEKGLIESIISKNPDFPNNWPVKDKKDNRRFDSKVVDHLKIDDLVLKTENISHSYPTCWRCETPLLNYATKSWFIKVEEIKDKLIANNQKINWVPEHLKDGRFGKWLEGARDWAVSRNRYWGAPLPVWVNDQTEKKVCIGSIEELEKLSGEKVSDLHKHFMDKIEFTIPGEEGVYRRIEEVFDCWFESGSMPYAQIHYPFESEDTFKLPAEFIAEGLDQTRGWFYTLHVLSTALFDKPAFKNVIVNGIILAEDGKKMSKSLRNYPEPGLVFDKFGADSVRFYLMNSPVVNADNLRFSEKGVEEVLRNVILPLWNSYSFLVTYANADNWQPKKYSEDKPEIKANNPLDLWLLSEVEILKREFSKEMDGYQLNKATALIPKFIDNLTNWYIRRSRRRFWSKTGTANDQDKHDAYSSLYFAILELVKILAPICPFITENIYQNLTNSNNSIHHSLCSDSYPELINEELSEQITTVQNIISLGLSLRKTESIKVKQPLKSANIAMPKTDLSDQLDTIKEELNVKELNFLDNPEDIATRIVKPNAKILGPRFGAKVQTIIQAAKSGDFQTDQKGNYLVAGETLTSDEIEIAYVGKEGHNASYKDGIVVSLNTEISPELKAEGDARELVRTIQEMRKEANYNVSDRILIDVSGADEVMNAHKNYICQETLSSIDQLLNYDLEKEVDGIRIRILKKS